VPNTTRISTGIAVLMPEIWAKEVGLRATARRVLANLVERVDFGGPGDFMNFQQLADIAATKIATGAPLGTVTFSEITSPRQRIVEPLAAYAAVQLDRDLLKRWLDATEDAVQKRLGISIANRVETDIYTTMTAVNTATGGGWTNTDVGSIITDFSLANFLAAIEAIWSAGGDLLTQGVDRINAVYHPNKWANFFNEGIANSGAFLSAAVRGEANGPARTGRFDTAFGAGVDFTGHVGATDGQVFAEGAVILAIKEEPEVVIQPFDLSTKVIAYVDYGVLVLWPELGVAHLTVA